MCIRMLGYIGTSGHPTGVSGSITIVDWTSPMDDSKLRFVTQARAVESDKAIGSVSGRYLLIDRLHT